MVKFAFLASSGEFQCVLFFSGIPFFSAKFYCTFTSLACRSLLPLATRFLFINTLQSTFYLLGFVAIPFYLIAFQLLLLHSHLVFNSLQCGCILNRGSTTSWLGTDTDLEFTLAAIPLLPSESSSSILKAWFLWFMVEWALPQPENAHLSRLVLPRSVR